MKIFIYIFWSFYQINLKKEDNKMAYFIVLYIYALIIFIILYLYGIKLVPKTGERFIRTIYCFIVTNIIAIPIYLIVPYKKIKNLNYTADQKYLNNKILLFGGAALFLMIVTDTIWDVFDFIHQGYLFLKKWVLRWI